MAGYPKIHAGWFLTSLLIAGLLLPASISALSRADSEPREIGIITAGKVKLLPRADQEAAPLHTLARGARVDIIERLNIWLKVSYKGETGYIRNRKKSVKIEPAPPPGPDAAPKSRAAKAGGGKTGKGGKIDALREEAGHIERKVEKHKAAVREISKKEKDVISRLDAVDLLLHDVRTRMFEIRTQLSDCRKNVQEIHEKIDEVKQRIRANESHVSRRLVTLYKLSNLGAAQFFASADSVHELMKRKTAISAILAHDEKKREHLITAQKEYMSLASDLEEREATMHSLEEEYKEQIQTASIEKKNRKELLAKIRDEKALEKALVLSLKGSAEALNQTISDLEQEAVRAKKAQKAKKAQEAKKAKESAVAKKPGSGKKTGKAAKAEPYRGKAFTKLKGLLSMPVKGKITGLFGPYKNPRFNTVNYRGGIDIKADRGEPVRAVSAGNVLYARWFKGYGNLVIIDHGDSYYTLYAHLEEVFKEKGDVVEAKEVIATVGDTGSIHGPKLHFQVRHHGEPMDPMKWVRRG